MYKTLKSLLLIAFMFVIPLSIIAGDNKDTIRQSIKKITPLKVKVSSAFELALQDAIIKSDMHLLHSFILPTVDFVIKVNGSTDMVKAEASKALDGLQYVLSNLPACTLTISSAQSGKDLCYVLEFEKKDKTTIVWVFYTINGQIYKIYVG